MYKYQNVSDVEQNVINIGVVKAGGEIVTSQVIENQNFKYLGEVQDESQTKESNDVPGIADPQVNATPETTNQEEQN